jgi:hypothetical protein
MLSPLLELVDHLIRDPLAIGPRDHAPQCGAVHGILYPGLTDPGSSARPRRRRRRLAWRLAAGAIPISKQLSRLIFSFFG